MNRDYLDYITDILNSINEIDEFTADMDFEKFSYDKKTINAVIRSLELPCEHVDILLVNGRHVDREYLLQDGDALSLLPMVEGG